VVVPLTVSMFQLVSRPAFDVEFDRGDDKLLVVHCVFTPPTDLPMSLDDTLQDTFCELHYELLSY